MLAGGKLIFMGSDETKESLAYVSTRARGPRAALMRAIERLSGFDRVFPKYEIWRRDIAGRDPRMFNRGIEMLGTKLEIRAPQWPPQIPGDRGLVMVCNHPFGIGDGIAALALAEDFGRPFRVLLNKEFMRVPEVQPFALPVDFSESREALETNLRTRNEARKLLREGVTIIVFPAGGVATARWPWSRAEELPWKTFAAKLVQSSRASVLPVYFEGQNSAFFHAASHIGASLRMSLLVAEFRRFAGTRIGIRIGDIVPFEELGHSGDRNSLTAQLYALVHRLAPGNEMRKLEDIRQRQPSRRYAWDTPLSRKRG